MYYQPRQTFREDLHLNTLAFAFPAEPVTFYFSREDIKEEKLTRLSLLQFPANVSSLFPDLGNAEFIYTSFTRKVKGFQPFPVDFKNPDNYNLVKKYYNREIRLYFVKKNILVERTFVGDNQVWLKAKVEAENAPLASATYDRYTVKVNYNHMLKTPELAVSYDGQALLCRKSIAQLRQEHNEAVSNPFEETAGVNLDDLFNRVLVVSNLNDDPKKKVYRIRKYEKLAEDIDKGEIIDYKRVYPVINRGLSAYLGYPEQDEESADVYDEPVRNRYLKYIPKIFAFKNKFLCCDEFRKIIPVVDDFTAVTAGRVSSASKMLAFGMDDETGEHHKDVVPQLGLNYGPYSQLRNSSVKMFFIAHKPEAEFTKKFWTMFSRGYAGFAPSCRYPYNGLPYYLGTNLDIIKGVLFEDAADPVSALEQQIQRIRSEAGNAPLLAIYFTPIGKNDKSDELTAVYYKVKEYLLNFGIQSQCIETAKALVAYKHDEEKKRYDFIYTLQNISIAVHAKMGGTPWLIDIPPYRELVVGVGAFAHKDTKYIGSAFSFDNTGAFNSFEYFQKDELEELAGSIQNAVIEYRNTIENPTRLVLHYYKDMNEDEVAVIEKALYDLKLDIPIFVVTINKTEAEDIFVFDDAYEGKMPYSGNYINLGRNNYLLCNNTRYQFGKKAPEGFPFPVKLKIHCPTDPSLLNQNTVQNLIDQVYQFSRIYWKSIKQQNLPVTIKYPEMVARIAPHFTGGVIPTAIGRNNLWFL